MPHIKKIVAMFLVSALLGGGVWYLSTTGGMSSISSSVLNTSTFSCTEQALKSQSSLYRTTVARHKKALTIKKKLEKEIVLLKKSDPQNELQKKEETLKVLVRQINTYYRFIKKYETCKKEIKLNPTVSSGIMSGEAKVAVSEKEYQALAAFKVSSPNGLNAFVRAIQFKIDTTPDVGIVADKWFLLHEGAGPIACQISANPELIDCELSGDMPVDIMSGMSRNYGIGGHIISVTGSGTVDIQISKITFNESRTYSDTSISSTPLSFGVIVPVVNTPPDSGNTPPTPPTPPDSGNTPPTPPTPPDSGNTPPTPPDSGDTPPTPPDSGDTPPTPPTPPDSGDTPPTPPTPPETV